jgi:hypothetical protein
MSNITVDDLKVMMTIIQACNKRGTFLAEELADVGSLYNKLVNAVKFIQEQNSVPRPSLPTIEEEKTMT